MSFTELVIAWIMAAYSRLEDNTQLAAVLLDHYTKKFERQLWGEYRASRYTEDFARKAVAGELGIFMVLVFGAVALVVVSIVLLFGMDIAGEFAQGIEVNNDYSDEANSTVNSTGNAFELFGTSVLVIPAAAVLAVLIGGLIGAVTMAGGSGALPGTARRGGR